MRQLGTSKPTGSNTGDSNSDNSKDKFVIPPFRPKPKVLESTQHKEISQSLKKKGHEKLSTIAEIPPFNKSKSSRQKGFKIELSKVEESEPSEQEFTINIVKPNDATPPSKPILKSTSDKPKRQKNKLMLYKNLRGNKKLSIIQEQKEEKDLKEYIPEQLKTFSPYLHNLVLSNDSKVLFYERFNHDIGIFQENINIRNKNSNSTIKFDEKVYNIAKDDKDRYYMLLQMSIYNDNILKYLSDKNRKPSNRIDWIKLKNGKNLYVIITESYTKMNLSYPEK